jgi:thiamine biosynthesis protein ThiS
MVYEMGCQPSETETIEIIVNGEPRRTPAGSAILTLLAELHLEPDRVAVELDGRIIKRSEWGSLELAPGAKLEIVQFVGGG